MQRQRLNPCARLRPVALHALIALAMGCQVSTVRPSAKAAPDADTATGDTGTVADSGGADVFNPCWPHFVQADQVILPVPGQTIQVLQDCSDAAPQELCVGLSGSSRIEIVSPLTGLHLKSGWRMWIAVMWNGPSSVELPVELTCTESGEFVATASICDLPEDATLSKITLRGKCP